jgi:hypothetical protein
MRVPAAPAWTSVALPAESENPGEMEGGLGHIVFTDARTGNAHARKALPGMQPLVTLGRGGYRPVAFGSQRFVVGGSGHVLTSLDATNWTTNAIPDAGELVAGGFGDGVFVMASRQGIWRSEDGVSWAKAPNDGGAGLFSSSTYGSEIVHGNGVFLGNLGMRLIRSPDGGRSWSTNSAGPGSIYTIGFGAGRFISIDHAGQTRHSTNGLNWEKGSVVSVLRPSEIVEGNRLLVAVGGSSRAYSLDGVDWTTVPGSPTEYSAAFVDGRFFGGGFKVLSVSEPIVTAAFSRTGHVTFFGAPGQTHRLESSSTLAPGSWAAEGTVTLPRGQNRGSWLAPMDRETNRFYRIVVPE